MKKKFQISNVIALSAGHLFHDVYAAFLSPMLPLLIAKHGISFSMVGILDLVRKSSSLFNPFIGLIADRVSVRYFIILTPAVTAIVMSLIGLAPGYGMLLILLFIAGLSSTFFHVPSPVMIKHVSGERIGTGMSLYMLGGELSRTLGPLIITGAVSLWGLEGTWRLMPFGIASSVILFFKLKDIRINRDFVRVKSDINLKVSFKKLYPVFSGVALFLFFRTAMKSALTLYLPTYLTFQGETLWTANIYLAILQLAGAAGTLLSGPLSDRIGRRNTILISSAITPFLMWMFLLSDSLFSVPLLSAIGFFLFAPGPVLLTIVQDHKSSQPSFINSMYMTMSFVISSAIIYLVGLSVDLTGFDQTYRLAVFMAAAGVPFVFLLPERTKT